MDDEKRAEARRRADRLRAEYQNKGEPLDWFEALYQEAEGCSELIPWGGVVASTLAEKTALNENEWAHGQARVPLINWLASLTEEDAPSLKRPLSALDVGCGLGHNAAVLYRAGFEVTAFDISETAVKWAASLYPDCSIQWEQQNLLDLPFSWDGQFDLVSETFTIQALIGAERELAFDALARLVAPDGRLLIICRGQLEERDASSSSSSPPSSSPPWPLTPAELSQFEGRGFNLVFRQDYYDNRTPPSLHFIAEFKKT